MVTVPLDALPALLRESLARARTGESIAIVDHGRTVARLVPEPEIPAGLARAATEGGITLPAPGQRRRSSAEAPGIPGGGESASQMVVEDRQ